MWVQLFGLVLLVFGIIIAVLPTSEKADVKGVVRASEGRPVKGSGQKGRKKKGKKRSSRAPLSEARRNFASRLELQLAGGNGSSATLPRQKSARQSPGKLGDGQKEVQQKLDSLFAKPSFNGRSPPRKAQAPRMEGSTQIQKVAVAPAVPVVGGDGEKYERMRRAGVPEAAIEQAKLRDMAGVSSQLQPKQGKKRGSSRSTGSGSGSKSKRSEKRASKKRASKKRKSKRGFFAGLFSKKPKEEAVSRSDAKKPVREVAPPAASQKFQGNPFMQELSSRLVRIGSGDSDDV